MILDFRSVHKKYNLNVNGVIHVGAHFGEEIDIYDEFEVGDVIFFEPIKSNFDVLLQNTLNKKSNINCHNVALGNDNKIVTINTSNNGKTSSSILTPKAHLIAHPEVIFDGKEEVEMNKLDDYQIINCNLLVMDVQGYELEVLKGGKNTLDSVDYIYTEVNRDEVYENNAKIEELDEFLLDYGFKRVETQWYYTQIWGDALYIKTKNKNLNTMKSQEKIDIVIQGPYTSFTDKIVDSYLDIPFVNNIIVSCWESDKKPIEKRRVKYVVNQHPVSSGTDNKNLQIVSSLNGLKQCETKFAIKTRSDQKFTHDSMNRMYHFFMNENCSNLKYQYENKKPYNKILVAGVYTHLSFCAKDHIFWGNTEDLIDLFDIPLERNSLVDIVQVPKERLSKYYQYFTRTETYLGAHYCSKFNDEIIRFLLLPDLHLYDGADYWYHVKNVSDNIFYSVFKSFPKNTIDFEWYGKDFSLQDYLNSAHWHEEGF